MRISTPDLYINATNTFDQQEINLNSLQGMISLGKQIVSASDDPIGAAEVVNFKNEIDKFNQYIRNGAAAENALEYEESVLQTVTDLYQRLIELTVQAGNTTLVAADRIAIAEEMTQRLQELEQLANIKDSNGDYIFSGFNTNQAPVFQDASGKFNYMGDEGQRYVALGTSTLVAASDTAKQIFFNIPTDVINVITNTGIASTTSTAGSLVNAGTLPVVGPFDLIINNIAISAPILDGVSTTDAASSALAIANAVNSSYSLDEVRAIVNATTVNLGIYTPNTIAANEFVINGISIIDTIGTEVSLMNEINLATAQTGVVVTQPGGAGTAMILSAKDGRNIQLQTLGTSATASFANFNLTAGPLNKVMAGTITLISHQDFTIGGANPSHAGFTAGTYNLSLNTGTGVISQAQVVEIIADITQTYSIIFNAGGTTFNIIQDSNPTAPITGFANVTYVPGQSIVFEGISVTITGTPNAGDTFGVTLKKQATQDAFTSIQNLITSITAYSGNPTQLSYEVGLGLSNLYNAQNAMVQARTEIGARLNVIESSNDFNETLRILAQKNKSLVQDLDYSAAITQLTEYNFALQAAMQSFLKIQGISLFNFLV